MLGQTLIPNIEMAHKGLLKELTIKIIDNKFVGTSLFLISLALLQPLLNGYHFGISDHSIQLSIINKMINPALYPNDPMLETVKGYVSFYPNLIVFLNSIFSNREALFFSLHIIFYFLFFGSTYLLSKQLFNHKTAIISVVLFALPLFSLGGSRISFTSFYPVSFALPFVIFALYQFYKSNYFISFLIIGILINFHTLIAGYAFCLIISYRLWQLVKKEIDWKEFITSLGIFVLFASPTLLWILSSPGEMSAQWIELLRLRSSHHSFPFSWKTNNYIAYGVFLLIGLLSMTKFSVRNSSLNKTLIFFLAVFGLCFLGIIFSELIPIKFILKGQLFRSTIFLSILSILYISNLIVTNWSGTYWNKIISFFMFLVFLLPMKFDLLVVGLTLILLDIIFSKNSKLVTATVRQISIVLLVTLIPIFTYMILSDQFNGIMIQDIIKRDRIYFFIGCLFLFFYVLSSIKETNIHRLIKSIILVSLTSYLIFVNLKFHSNYAEKRHWRDIQLWAKDNSQLSDIFITPPNLTGFRVFSERATLGEWKDGTQQYFDDDYPLIWWERMQELGYSKNGKNTYNKLSKIELINLGRKHGAKYVILTNNHQIDLAPVYQNKKFKAYMLSK